MKIDFYEKPGCVNNTKQKQILEDIGHTVTSYSLLTQTWTTETLRPYFGNMPVSEWFNMAAPRIKSGEIDPNNYNEHTALTVMLTDPLLIRRPLICVGNNKVCGFNNDLVKSLIDNLDVSDLQSCPNLKNSCK